MEQVDLEAAVAVLPAWISPRCSGRLPTQTLADLKVGEAVMIVASVPPAPASTKVTAITLLTGVEPILTASPAGTTPELSPWNMSDAPPDAGGGQ